MIDKVGFAILVAILITPTVQAQDAKTQAAGWFALCCMATEITPVDPSPRELVEPESEQASEVDYSQTVTYQQAYSAYQSDNRPMVVMITATWCPHCPRVKEYLKKDFRDGKYGDATLAIVDYDAEPELAAKLFGRWKHTLPFVGVYYRDTDGKERSYIRRLAAEIPSILAAIRERKTNVKKVSASYSYPSYLH